MGTVVDGIPWSSQRKATQHDREGNEQICLNDLYYGDTEHFTSKVAEC